MQVNVPYMDPVGIETESHDTRVEINVSCLFHVSVSGYAKKVSSCDNILSSTLMKRVCKKLVVFMFSTSYWCLKSWNTWYTKHFP